MSKYYVVLLFLLFPFSVVHANQGSIDEDIQIIYDYDIVSEIYITYTIPKDFHEDKITIHSSLFQELYFIQNKKNIEIHFIIQNNSNNNYQMNFKDIDFSHLNYDYSIFKWITHSFQGNPILQEYQPYRCLNDAILSLYETVPTIQDLDNSILYYILYQSHYRSLSDYYIDYFNKKYSTHYFHLKDFPSYIVQDIFQGDCSTILEDDKSIIEVGYSFWFQKGMKLNIQNTTGSIYDFMNNIFLQNQIIDVSSKKSPMIDIMIYYDIDKYPALRNIGFDTNLEFTLYKKKEISLPFTRI